MHDEERFQELLEALSAITARIAQNNASTEILEKYGIDEEHLFAITGSQAETLVYDTPSSRELELSRLVSVAIFGGIIQGLEYATAQALKQQVGS